jgi:hypothetical protein
MKIKSSPWIVGAQVGVVELLLTDALIQRTSVATRFALEIAICVATGVALFALTLDRAQPSHNDYLQSIQVGVSPFFLLLVRPMFALHKALPRMVPGKTWLWKLVAGSLPALFFATGLCLPGYVIGLLDPTFINPVSWKEGRAVFYPLVSLWIGGMVVAAKNLEALHSSRLL